jgi:hypothetical protein
VNGGCDVLFAQDTKEIGKKASGRKQKSSNRKNVIEKHCTTFSREAEFPVGNTKI